MLGDSIPIMSAGSAQRISLANCVRLEPLDSVHIWSEILQAAEKGRWSVDLIWTDYTSHKSDIVETLEILGYTVDTSFLNKFTVNW